MPIYVYLCSACGAKFDLLEGVTTEKVERRCKKCGSKKIHKTWGTFSVGKPKEKSCAAFPPGMCPREQQLPDGSCPPCPGSLR